MAVCSFSTFSVFFPFFFFFFFPLFLPVFPGRGRFRFLGFPSFLLLLFSHRSLLRLAPRDFLSDIEKNHTRDLPYFFRCFFIIRNSLSPGITIAGSRVKSSSRLLPL